MLGIVGSTNNIFWRVAQYVTLKVEDQPLTVNSQMLQEGLVVVDKSALLHSSVACCSIEFAKILLCYGVTFCSCHSIETILACHPSSLPSAIVLSRLQLALFAARPTQPYLLLSADLTEHATCTPSKGQGERAAGRREGCTRRAPQLLRVRRIRFG